MSQSNLIVCPGIHSPELTASFVRGIGKNLKEKQCLILPTEKYPPYNPIAIDRWLKTHHPFPKISPPLSFIAFSAGVVGSIGTAIAWQLQGGKIELFIAFDGWGMPLAGNFPIYRISHDYFTHWSSRLLGGGKSGFYADPALEHLELWQFPDTCNGWQLLDNNLKTYCSLAEYLDYLVNFP